MPPLRYILLLRHRRPFSTAAASLPSGAPSTAADGTFKWLRDRGLDLAVERERNLIPLINIKNLLASEPSKAVPISAIADRRLSLGIPFRPVDFLRRYPAVFREFLPAGIAAGVHPHFALTDQALELHSDETLMYQKETYRKDVADRLLKLLMLSKANRLPISVIQRLRWDLGLPEDFETSLIPDFPDYFRLVESRDSRYLELVCWISEMAVSAMEKRGDSGAFPVQYSRGFEMDKKNKKWVEDWQKLPYFSPYENNADRLSSAGDESDRWVVAILHELLQILVPKKTEKENVLCLGEWLGLRSRFKRALLRHPGIFYISSKNYTYTLVLKEGYRRGMLVENHVLMSMRSKYIRLMNSSSKEESDKPVSVQVSSRKEETEGESLDSSEDEKDEEDGERSVVHGGRRSRGADSEAKGRVGDHRRGARGKRLGKSRERFAAKASLETEKKGPSSTQKRPRSVSKRSSGSSALTKEALG